jgi:beta-phosphoglucomutase
MGVRALIFDFDGVLADTEPLHWEALESVASSLGVSLSQEEYFQRLLGLVDRDCLVFICERAGVVADAARLDALLVRKRERYDALARGARLNPGLEALLRRLHQRYSLAIASGAFRDDIEAVLERDRVRDLFSVIVAAEDVPVGKPAPDPFVRALALLNATAASPPSAQLGPRADRQMPLSAADCMVIEDSPRGIAAARAAGMRCVAVTTSHGREALMEADAVVDDLDRFDPESLLA